MFWFCYTYILIEIKYLMPLIWDYISSFWTFWMLLQTSCFTVSVDCVHLIQLNRFVNFYILYLCVIISWGSSLQSGTCHDFWIVHTTVVLSEKKNNVATSTSESSLRGQTYEVPWGDFKILTFTSCIMTCPWCYYISKTYPTARCCINLSPVYRKWFQIFIICKVLY